MFYSDVELPVLNAVGVNVDAPDQNVTSLPLAELPTTVPALTSEHPFLTTLQQVCHTLDVCCALWPAGFCTAILSHSCKFSLL